MVQPINPIPGSGSQDYPYFRRVWSTVVVALFAAAFIPLLVIGGGMYYYAAGALREKTLEFLRSEVLDHRNAIDAFLSERTTALKLIAENLKLESLKSPQVLGEVFQSLQKQVRCFVDLGVIDGQGRHLAYVGPFDLMSKNYKEAQWFEPAMEGDSYISDVFTGFRQVPHFFIAVRQTGSEGSWILRATVDSDYFNTVVSNFTRHHRGEAFLVSRRGLYQAVPAGGGKLMEPSGIEAPHRFEGVREERIDGDYRVMTWLSRVPWLCVVQVDRSTAFAELHRMRSTGLLVLFLSVLVMGFTVLLTTNYLVERLEKKRKSIRFLDHQFRQASRQASSMQLAEGLLQEAKDTLSNIDAAVQWVEAAARKEPSESGEKPGLTDVLESTGQIRSEAGRCRKLMDRILAVSRTNGPLVMEIDMNGILDEVLGFFERQFLFQQITAVRDYQDPPPVIRSDPARLRQVFQNLIANAASALGKKGVIHLKTRSSGGTVTITVADSGPGISREHLDRIFDPMFTTRPGTAGMGLTISREIVEKLGGKISVMSDAGRGAAFHVELPVKFTPPME